MRSLPTIASRFTFYAKDKNSNTVNIVIHSIILAQFFWYKNATTSIHTGFWWLISNCNTQFMRVGPATGCGVGDWPRTRYLPSNGSCHWVRVWVSHWAWVIRLWNETLYNCLAILDILDPKAEMFVMELQTMIGLVAVTGSLHVSLPTVRSSSEVLPHVLSPTASAPAIAEVVSQEGQIIKSHVHYTGLHIGQRLQTGDSFQIKIYKYKYISTFVRSVFIMICG